MRKIALFISLFILSALSMQGQTLKGKVNFVAPDGSKEDGGFATVLWIEGNTAVDADYTGAFAFKKIKGSKATLVASFVGYKRDTVEVALPSDNVVIDLREENELDALVIQARQSSNYLSKTASVRTEVISAAGLCKMACCNLAESFENSASVSVGYSDAVSGAKQIKLLGLSGAYTQMLDENRPVMRGLSSPFGLSYIPGQWLESIQIAKGPSSVINGSEAITGQINMEHRKPTAEIPFYLNLFTNSNLRVEGNIASSLQLNDKWSTVVMGHVSTDTKKHDSGNDSFRDDPMTTQYNIDNRWLYQSGPGGTQIRFGVKAFSDERIGGQMNYKKGMNDESTFEAVKSGIWGSEIHNSGIDGFFKIGVPIAKEGATNIAVVANYSYYDMESSYGGKYYDGNQNMAFVNAMFQDEINGHNKYTFGLSGQFDFINENYRSYSLKNKDIVLNSEPGFLLNGRHDRVYGAYGEYTYTDDKVTVVAGVRVDRHSNNKWLFTPRANIKYSFTPDLVVRLTGGRGYRVANIVADNLGILSSAREIYIEEEPEIEDAWTFGGNITQYFKIGESENSYISFDYFRSSFNSQVVIDWDKRAFEDGGAGYVAVYNCHGRSFTDTYQVDLSIEPFKGFTAMTTFRYTNAKVDMDGQGLVDRTLMSKYKGVLNLQYATNLQKWVFDFTAQLNGPAALPLFMGGGETSVYPMLYAQVTKKFKGLDIYAGVENMTNYKQKNPIIGAGDPFSDKFNAAMVWGPLMGTMVYGGIRLTIWH